MFNAKETRRGSSVFCGDEGNTAVIRNSRFYMAEGEEMQSCGEFKFENCVEIRKGTDLQGNVPLAGKASASSFDCRHPVGNATDKDAKTTWRSDSGTSAGEWLELDFGAPRRIDFLILRENTFLYVSRFAILSWEAKTSGWRDCFQGGAMGSDFLAALVPVTTQKIRLYVHRTAYGSPGINEIVAYG